MRAVLTPMQAAMRRFCVTPRTNRPRRVRAISAHTPTSTRTAKPTIAMRLKGSVRLLITSTPPDSQVGFSTGTFCAPKIERTACCSIRLMPQVASSVSSGRPYSQRITLRSSAAPTSAAARKDTGIATST